jgi:hypothetical protein
VKRASVALFAVLLVGSLLAACGGSASSEAPEGASDSTAPSESPGDTTAATPAANPTTTSAPTSSPTATASPRSESWSVVASLDRQSNRAFSSFFESPFFTPKTGDMRIEWSLAPLADEWSAGIVVFKKGQTPENSTGAVDDLRGLAYIEPGSQYESGGTMTFRLQKGKPYYILTEMWHSGVNVTVSEKD